MKIGLVITTHNRSEYTKQCFDSVKASLFSNYLFIVIVDDCSTEKEAIYLVDDFEIDGIDVIKIFNEANLGIAKSLQIGFDKCIEHGAAILMNLDNDAIVKRGWLFDMLNVFSNHPNSIVSGFNTLSKDPIQHTVRHPILEEFDDHYRKKSIGGINMIFNTEVYRDFVKPSLQKQGHWDWNVCKTGITFYVTKPSVVQHIGINKGTNLNNPDIAHDF